MTITFLVAINSDDVLGAPSMAEDITDALDGAGFLVESVKPWHRDALAASAPLSPLGSQAGLQTTPTSPGLTQ